MIVNLIKTLLITTVALSALGLLETWYQTFLVGRYWENASFLGTVLTGFVAPISLLFVSSFLIHLITKIK